jgi:hypothetical protein
MARIKPTGLISTALLLLTMPPAQGFPQAQDLVVGVGFVFAPYNLPAAGQRRFWDKCSTPGCGLFAAPSLTMTKVWTSHSAFTLTESE